MSAHNFADWPICPYCDKEDTDVTDLHARLDPGVTGSKWCPFCERDYVVTIDVSHSYSTKGRTTSGEFLKKAQEEEAEYERQSKARQNLTSLDVSLDSFRCDCWPEILAVVEAAELATYRWDEANHEMSQALSDERICEALDALDKKAGAL